MDDTIPTRLAYDATHRFVLVGPHTLQATQYRYFSTAAEMLIKGN